MNPSRLGWATLPLVLALAACGGGGNDTPSPAPPVAGDRIEPYDPSGTAKVATSQQPVSPVVSAQATRTIALGALTAVKGVVSATPGTPLQIGEARSVADTATVAATAALLRWQPTARGTQAAALRFTADGAYGVRLGVLVQSLPEGAVLRFYGEQGAGAMEVRASELQDIAARNARGGRGADRVGRPRRPALDQNRARRRLPLYRRHRSVRRRPKGQHAGARAGLPGDNYEEKDRQKHGRRAGAGSAAVHAGGGLCL